MSEKTPLFYHSSDFVLYNEDCLKVMQQLPNNSIDMVFADPPYFLSESKTDLSYKGEWDLSKGIKENVKFQANWIREAKRILKPEGTIWVTGTHHNIYQCGYVMQILNFKILNDITWFKPKKTPFSRNFFNFSHESIIWARKNKETKYYLNPKMLYANEDKYTDYNDKLNQKGQHMSDVWDIFPCSKKEIDWHPTPKPLKLLKRIVLASTKPGAIILDPFNGSGTTGIAVKELGFKRKYIGIDLNKFYLEKTIERLNSLNHPTLNHFEQQKRPLRQQKSFQN